MRGSRPFSGILCTIALRAIKDRVNNGNSNPYVVLVFGTGHLDSSVQTSPMPIMNQTASHALMQSVYAFKKYPLSVSAPGSSGCRAI